MGTYQITGPNGKKYRVTGDTPQGAMKALRGMVDGESKAPAQQQHPEFDGSKVPGYNPETGMVERSKFASAAHGAADVAGFGFGDELAAGVTTLIDKVRGEDRSYSQNLDHIRGIQKQAEADNPKSFLAGQIGGGIASGIAAAPVSLSARAGAGLGSRVLAGMGDGAIAGGLYGVGSGEGTEDRAVEGVKNAGIGLFAGGAFPVIAKGASSVYQAIADALMGRSAGKQAGVSPEVLRMLSTAFDADGTRGKVGRVNIAKAGQDAMLADAGPNAKAILDTAIQRGGPGAVSARSAIAARSDKAAGAVGDALDASLGQPVGVTATRTAIRQGSAPARGQAYDAAYSAPINYADPRGMALEQIIKTRVPQNAIAEANALMRAEGNHSKQIIAKIADDGTVQFESLPDVRQLDYITRGLNEVADQADGAGKLGGTTAKGRAYGNLSSEIRDMLRDLVPEYGQALQTAADPIRRSKAVELGSKILSPAMTRDQVDEAVSGMTAPEKDALAQGIRSNLDDLMANVTRTVQDGDTGAREAIKAIKDLSSRANREKLAAAIGDDPARDLFAEVDRAATSFDLRASVAENSKTYARQATDKRIKEITEPGVVGTALQGKPVNAAQRLVQVLTGQTPAKVAGKQDRIYSELAEALTRPAQGGKPIFDAIDNLGTSDQATRLMVERIARALSGPRLSYPAIAPVSDRLDRR